MSDLSELFARDPLLLSEQDIAAIVTREQQQQAQFMLGPKPAAPKKAPAGTASANLLKELGLDIT